MTRLDCVPFSIVVNKHGERFYDEGEDVWPKRYAIWGRLIAQQPDQVGYVVIDAKSLELFMPSVFPPIKADSLEELAAKMDLPPKNFQTRLPSSTWPAATRRSSTRPNWMVSQPPACCLPKPTGHAR